MAIDPQLVRLQTTALVIRTFHWQRRQYCSLACSFVIPALVLVLLSYLSHVLVPPKFSAQDYELRPKGAFVPRPFDPVACLRFSKIYDKEVAEQYCQEDPFVPSNTVPIYAKRSIADDIGAHSYYGSGNQGLLSAFSLDPFAYKPAFDPNASFYNTKTRYDADFYPILRRASSQTGQNFSYDILRPLILNDKFDESYKSVTESFGSRDQLFDGLYSVWFEGVVFETYSTAIAFDAFSNEPDGGLSLTATVFHNGSSFVPCWFYCAHVSTVVRLYSAIYQQLAPKHSAFAFLRRMPRVDPYENYGIINLGIGIIVGFLSHFLFPSFLRFLVLERVSRLRSMMASMGLRHVQYWTGTYISLLLVYIVSAAIIIAVGAAANIPFFSKNEFATYAILFFICKSVKSISFVSPASLYRLYSSSTLVFLLQPSDTKVSYSHFPYWTNYKGVML